jgi:organic radical activating enzyme
MIHCPLIYKGLAISTTGWVGHCCIQQRDVKISDWSEVTDLNEWYKNQLWFANVRQDLENDIQNPACKTCWKYENNNATSKRQRWNLRNDISQDNNIDLEFVDLRLSNKCNLQCKMCYGGASSQISNLALELKEKGIKTHLLKSNAKTITGTENILNLILELPNLKILRFAGGEPFIMPEVEEFLYKLVERGKTDLEIEFITNCTSAKPKIIETLEKFRHVELACSIDTIGDELEYQRYPAKWKTIEKNFIRMYNSKCNVNITPCLTHLNLLSIDKFLNWSSQFEKSKVGYSEVDHPSFLNFRYVPLEVRKKLIDNLKNIDLKNKNVNWHKFVDTFVYEYKEPSQNDCNLLKHYSEKIWDYKCNIKYLDMYPHMNYMIERANDEPVI